MNGTLLHQRATLAALLVALLVAPLYAQTPPRPAVRLQQLPNFVADTWPADLNGDGISDLVSAGVTVAIGRGDGTFGPPRSLGLPASPIAVGDFNNDGKVDVVVSGVAILPGNGDGTFGAAREITGPPAPPDRFEGTLPTRHALAADFNADGRRDLVLVNPANLSVDVYPGNGDFTFGTPVSLPAGDTDSGPPQQLTVADFNNDGRRDVAVLSLFNRIDVFLNRGALLFTPFAMHFPGRSLVGITAGDLNRDGRADLVVVETWQGFKANWNPGRVGVLLGNGNGTFKRVVYHDTGALGSVTVVVGDFNADGRLDVATGNRSTEFRDYTCINTAHYWDSVTIMPGLGDGRFARPRTFHLDYTFFDSRYYNSHNALKTSDLNGDGRTDLIASPGALLLTKGPVANRPPVVFEGPDLPATVGDYFTRLEAFVSDPDFDAVRVQWRVDGQLAGDTPQTCGESLGPTTTYTVTATDSEGASTSQTLTILDRDPEGVSVVVAEPDGGEAITTQRPFTIEWGASADEALAESFDVWSSSDDGETWRRIEGCTDLPSDARSCQWARPAPLATRAFVRVVANRAGQMVTFGVSGRFSIVSGAGAWLPDDWENRDIGSTGAIGTANFDGSTFTVNGAGADIGGNVDHFHFVSKAVQGDFDFIARVAGVQNLHQLTKAGLMVRNGNIFSESAAHASIFATPTSAVGVLTQARLQERGPTVEGSRVAVAPAVWLKLSRRGSAISYAYRRSATGAWIALPGVSPALGASVYVGFALGSHVDGRRATARFDNVTLTQP